MTTTKRRAGARARTRNAAAVVAVAALGLTACTGGSPDEDATGGDAYTTREVTDGTTTFVVVDNPGDGKTLSYSKDSGVELITEDVDGATTAFKDMNANGKLDTWEDWRLDATERAADLAPQLSQEQMVGLMTWAGTNETDGMTDEHKKAVSEGRLRILLSRSDNDIDSNVVYSNAVEAYVETLASEDEPYVPVVRSTDPRHGASMTSPLTTSFTEEGEFTQWPMNLGMAATFDVDLLGTYGQVLSQEYRDLGFANLLGPQIDLTSDPRWGRDKDTLGEDSEMAAAMAEAYVDGIQNTLDEDGTSIGWGDDSVTAMTKHFPSDAMGEGGREAHNDYGKYAVWPGDNLAEHLSVFESSADTVSSVMLSYSIGIGADGQPYFTERKGSAYEPEVVQDVRDMGIEGPIVTDWRIFFDEGQKWGVEDLSVEDRFDLLLESGIDQFGGLDDPSYVAAAADRWQEAYEAGERDVDITTRLTESTERNLAWLIQSGMYENPYVDLDESHETVGSADKLEASTNAHLNSIVMTKNDGVIAQAQAEDWSDKTVYVPRQLETSTNIFTGETTVTDSATIDTEVLARYVGTVVTDEPVTGADGTVTGYTMPDLSDVDLALVGMDSPAESRAYDEETDTYYPMSLQYRPYTADGEHVRQVSIAGDILPDGTQENRSYYGHTTVTSNESVLDTFDRVVDAVQATGKDIPVVVALYAKNPVVPTEIEADADAILVGWGVIEEAYIQTALGLHEPQGRLPIGFPASMDAVEASQEDVPKDVETYVDSAGNDWAFGFGLDWSGVIE
jgi:beta-glucosidase